jgi:outer membrane protein insertion porin family
MYFTRGIWKSTSLFAAALFFAFATAAPVMAAPEIVVSGDRADAENIKSFFAGTSQAEIDKGLEQGATPRSPPAVRAIASLFA